MKLSILRKKSSKDLHAELSGLLREQLNLKIQVAHGKLQKSHLLKIVRRNIVWVNTLLTEKQRNIS